MIGSRLGSILHIWLALAAGDPLGLCEELREHERKHAALRAAVRTAASKLQYELTPGYILSISEPESRNALNAMLALGANTPEVVSQVQRVLDAARGYVDLRLMSELEFLVNDNVVKLEQDPNQTRTMLARVAMLASQVAEATQHRAEGAWKPYGLGDAWRSLPRGSAWYVVLKAFKQLGEMIESVCWMGVPVELRLRHRLWHAVNVSALQLVTLLMESERRGL